MAGGREEGGGRETKERGRAEQSYATSGARYHSFCEAPPRGLFRCTSTKRRDVCCVFENEERAGQRGGVVVTDGA